MTVSQRDTKADTRVNVDGFDHFAVLLCVIDGLMVSFSNPLKWLK